MIALSAGHFYKSPGGVNNETTENMQAQLWVDRIAEGSDKFITVVPNTTISEKIKFINASNYSHAVEVHFNTNKFDHSGSLMLYHPDVQESKQVALELNELLTPIIGYGLGTREGWYRNSTYNGLDFFLERTSMPSVIIMPGHFNDISSINSKRSVCCNAMRIYFSTLTGLIND